jgi:hypothetical protein
MPVEALLLSGDGFGSVPRKPAWQSFTSAETTPEHRHQAEMIEPILETGARRLRSITADVSDDPRSFDGKPHVHLAMLVVDLACTSRRNDDFKFIAVERCGRESCALHIIDDPWRE